MGARYRRTNNLIQLTGTVEAGLLPTSPPQPGWNSVTFPKPLTGGSENYVVMITTMNGGSAYVSDTYEVNGNFSGFSFIAETDCTLMYMVAKVGC